MKKILCLALMLMYTPIVMAETLNLPKSEKMQIILAKPVQKNSKSLLIKDSQVLNELVNYQNQKDLEDIELLWKGTVENNKVIEFALKKLATPENQRRVHTSLMSKTLSAIISGTSLLPSFTGAEPYIQTGAFAAGRLAQNLLNKKNIPQTAPLTDTELIELAGLIEELQDKIINAYYNYKSNLSLLKDVRTRILLYNKNYNKALDKGDLLDVTISSAMYNKAKIEEFEAEETAKKYHLELQRLAGKKAVDNLSLYQFNFNSTLYKQKGGK